MLFRMFIASPLVNIQFFQKNKLPEEFPSSNTQVPTNKPTYKHSIAIQCWSECHRSPKILLDSFHHIAAIRSKKDSEKETRTFLRLNMSVLHPSFKQSVPVIQGFLE